MVASGTVFEDPADPIDPALDDEEGVTRRQLFGQGADALGRFAGQLFGLAHLQERLSRQLAISRLSELSDDALRDLIATEEDVDLRSAAIGEDLRRLNERWGPDAP